MGLEIERKFLVDTSKLPGCLKPMRIAQGYLNDDPERTVRIRVTDTEAFITVKGKSTDDGRSRYEWEEPIDPDEAEIMMEMCYGVIEKSRYHMIHQGRLWEIDVFHGLNIGLIVAEVEFKSVDESIILPDWVKTEVTGDPKYYNSNLTKHPYKDWE